MTEQSADLPRLMIMVDVELAPSTTWRSAADCTKMLLIYQLLIELLKRNPMNTSKVLISPAVRIRKIPSIRLSVYFRFILGVIFPLLEANAFTILLSPKTHVFASVGLHSRPSM